MKKIVFIVIGCMFFSYAFSQDSLSTTGAKTQIIKLKNHPNDHFMFQLSSDHWAGETDSIRSNQKGFSRGFAAYFMFNKPFKTSPNYSLGFGLGVSSSNIFFKDMEVDLTNTSATELPFTAESGSDHFKKYKLSTSYLEIPIELRYFQKPLEPDKSWKAAVGLNLGTLINAHTKGKDLENLNNNLLNSYTEKENSKHFMNTTRVMVTARVGYGIVSLFGTYSLTTLLNAGEGPTLNPYQFGIALSGL